MQRQLSILVGIGALLILLFGSTCARLYLEGEGTTGSAGGEERENEGSENEAENDGDEGAASRSSANGSSSELLAAAQPGVALMLDFAGDALDQLPADFISARTGPGSDGTWVVLADTTAPSPPNVLAQTSTDNTSGRFPMAIATASKYQDLEASVKFKAISGRVDQAGGLVFRWQDADNYYLVRANALENNVRLYHVVGGQRTQFAGSDLQVTANEWHTLKVTCVGNQIKAYFDDQKVIDASDSTFQAEGLVGVWTKADSVTYFDDLEIMDNSQIHAEK
jgi:hypothetical protein